MRALTLLTAACVAAVWLGAPRASAEQAYSGNNDYQMFCASCHGPSAKGDGPIAKSLPKKPADLTHLAAKNNAVFPDEKVFKTIDGRTSEGAHGNADMPAWGEVFAKSQESLGEDAAKIRITALVHYLSTIQEKQ